MPQPQPPVVDGADLSLGAFLLMPVFAAGPSVAMWLQMPTLRDALESRADRIEARRSDFARLASMIPADPVVTSACLSPVTPAPRFDESDRLAGNLEIVGPDTRRDIGITTALGDEGEAYLTGQVAMLMIWRTQLQVAGRRMSRARIAAEIDGPLAANRYVLFYGGRLDGAGGLHVDAHLFDVASGAKVCALGFDGGSDRLLQELDQAVRASPRG